MPSWHVVVWSEFRINFVVPLISVVMNFVFDSLEGMNPRNLQLSDPLNGALNLSIS